MYYRFRIDGKLTKKEYLNYGSVIEAIDHDFAENEIVVYGYSFDEVKERETKKIITITRKVNNE